MRAPLRSLLSDCRNTFLLASSPSQLALPDFCARNASSIKCKFPLLTKLTSKREQCRTAWPETYVHQGVQIGFRNVSVRPQKLRAICAESGSVPLSASTMQSVRVTCTGDIAHRGRQFGCAQEQEIYANGPVAWQAGKRHLWKESCITALFQAGEDVGEALAMAANSVGLVKMPRYEIEDLEDRDWVQQVESQFKPIEVSQGLWIVPKWSSPPDAKALNVIIDPGLAFGTGEHPTTRLCLQWLHHVVSPADCILDYGTGSGILSIAALKMGAAMAVGVDIDPMAISSAKYNASLNNLAPNTLQVHVAPGDGDDPVPKDSGEFDVVAANILLNPLVQLASRIAGYCKPGGLVGVSGILLDQVAQVKEAYSPFLEGMAVSHDNGWACVSGRKKVVNKLAHSKGQR